MAARDVIDRRGFLAALAGAGACARTEVRAYGRAYDGARNEVRAYGDAGTEVPAYRGTLCLFSKHLPSMDWSRLAAAAKSAGFGGIDLTVRPKGHVLPERVAEDLPRALDAIRAEAVSVPMITTALVSADDAAARPTLETAGKLGIPFVKPGYYSYTYKDVRAELAQAARQFAGLASLAADYGVTLGFHNHNGNVGASGWDAAAIVDQAPSRAAGYYFDVAHAVIEGGVGGWRAATALAASRLRMVALKDFVWAKTDRGWRPRWVPLGEGVVDWPRHFADLTAAGFAGPISLHLEYLDVSGPPSAAEARALEAATRDLAFLRARLEESYVG